MGAQSGTVYNGKRDDRRRIKLTFPWSGVEYKYSAPLVNFLQPIRSRGCILLLFERTISSYTFLAVSIDCDVLSLQNTREISYEPRHLGCFAHLRFLGVFSGRNNI